MLPVVLAFPSSSSVSLIGHSFLQGNPKDRVTQIVHIQQLDCTNTYVQYLLARACMDASPVGQEARRLCAVTGGRGFMARHLVAALLRSGDWCVRITDLAPNVAMEPDEDDGLLGAALRDGRATYISVDVCQLAQLTQGTSIILGKI